ncbi:MAG TPA: class I SAM-dependent methyltransferase [Bacteroidales bacterium]|jgi:SAM-dependent methyltransferase|nr:class I SAM-dependent methyltransferase [Bacteroidales bacterium]HPD23679.1 class I SAM-dependent methyltransferase [Bacteroidales bacterium]HRS99794.1 class I SAM-dependent methyltransferase [Bacteroidales bacterium]HRT80505.1 class I SAM-dependent methyltransferase [Bacteroidales bacterium]
MKRKLIIIIRKLGLSMLADKCRFHLHKIKYRKNISDFFKTNDGVPMPPAYFIYETYRLNYNGYYFGGKETAQELAKTFSKYVDTSNCRILDWGCGPGRIVRHLPEILPASEVYGSDYNKAYIEWCSSNLKNVKFITNELAPPIDFQDSFFDVIYGISIFTHLSKEMHYAWATELLRILKPGGILYLTMHGEVFRTKLIDADKLIFDKGQLVCQTTSKEGHRTYGAFQPPFFVRKLFKSASEIIHFPGTDNNGSLTQDVWIIKK